MNVVGLKLVKDAAQRDNREAVKRVLMEYIEEGEAIGMLMVVSTDSGVEFCTVGDYLEGNEASRFLMMLADDLGPVEYEE